MVALARWISSSLSLNEIAEMTEVSPQHVEALRSIVGEVPLQIIPHLELKHLSRTAKATIRTGDTTLWGNIIIVSG